MKEEWAQRVGPRSVRFRITMIAMVVVGVVLLGAGFGLVVAQRRSLTANLEEALGREADGLAGDARSDDLTTPLDVSGDDDTVAQVIPVADDGGGVVAATSNASGRPPIVEASAGAGTRTVDSVLDEGGRFLVVSRVAATPDGDVLVLVGAPLDDIDEAGQALARSLLLGVPIVIALLGAMVWSLVGRTLRPVEAIRSEVNEIGGSDLHRRVPVPAGDDEVTRLARTMNAMLDRLEASAKRQNRFVGDASHELRTPLTRIRSEVEVDLSHPTGADMAATHRSVLVEVEGLQRLVDDLLWLARSDGETAAASPSRVDLDDLVLDAVHRAVVEGAAAGIEVISADVNPAEVNGGRQGLQRALRNVLENAVRHATTRVVISLDTSDGCAVLRVADDGPGIPVDQVHVIFERFTRLDEARSAADGGSGLGLAIARDALESAGGTIHVDTATSDGATFVITLPLAPGPA